MSKNYSSIGTERAISPVVGVMLMLVVVIIIAAAVSAYSGNLLAGIGKKAPTLSMDVKVVQTGDWHGSGFFATVTSVSEPIRTKDLRIVTSWTGKVQHVEGSSAYTSTTVSDGNTVVPGIKNINTLFNPANTATELPSGLYVAPFG
ncbi:MAG: type IV pilin, partial [Methanoregulaceae archaeon]